MEEEEKSERNVADPISRKLFENRTILISGGIDHKISERVVSQLLAMAIDSDDDIHLYVNSPGGHVESADSIFDIINFVKPRVIIIGTGWVASAGAHIFLSVPLKDRYCLTNTRFLLHQPSGGVGGRASDVQIEAEEILRMRMRLNMIIARQTGQALEKVETDTDHDFWMSAEEAKDYGIVGKIIERIDEVK
ncbi:MAG TPA: ATP-dependent Clp protease proteolytic subunit [Lentisphaeria bacterium]|jgi:ATP-dependent Clp protease protease subunit|nr:ATP-dependent Clp protease proteolytic subunit [Lentisphaeria bacterium]